MYLTGKLDAMENEEEQRALGFMGGRFDEDARPSTTPGGQKIQFTQAKPNVDST